MLKPGVVGIQFRGQASVYACLKANLAGVMKIGRKLLLLGTLILGLGQGIGRSQTYYYTGPITGYIDAELTPGGHGQGGFQATFGTITETLYYDPIAQTLEQIGFITVSPFNGSFNITSGPFPIVVMGSATATVGNSGSIPFDITFAGAGIGTYSTGPSLLVPVSGSGIYNGQPFSGNWNLYMNLGLDISAVSPTSLTFTEHPVSGPSLGESPGQPVIPGTDLSTGNNDNNYFYSWSQNSIQAMAVPEPDSISLLAFGVSALALLRPRLRSR